MRFRWNGPKNPSGQVKLGVGIMIVSVVLYVYLTSNGRSLTPAAYALILGLIAAGFCCFSVGTLRYLKALEAEAKKAMENAEAGKEEESPAEQTENEKKCEELKTLLDAGLISHDEYNCAMKKYTK